MPGPGPFPLLVTGCHRSGSSLTALILSDLGVDLGDTRAADPVFAPRGYGEDATGRELGGRMAALGCGDHPVSWTDWGWRLDDDFDEVAVRSLLPEMSAYAAARASSAADRPWGWKDPRATYVLDLWSEVIAGLRCLILHRPLAEAVAALGEVGLPSPAAGHLPAIWEAHARRLADHAERHPTTAIVVDGVIGADAPEELAAITEELIGAPLPALAGLGHDERRRRCREARERAVEKGRLRRRAPAPEVPTAVLATADAASRRLRALDRWTRSAVPA